jgi:hypothetical protein
LTLKELIEIYQSPELEFLDTDRAKQSSRIYYQLWRNMMFAEWMARADHPNTKAYHVNLVREGSELQSVGEFQQLIRREFSGRFQRMTWEQVYRDVHRQPGVANLAQYMETKTAGLKRAFSITNNSYAGTSEFRSKGRMLDEKQR